MSDDSDAASVTGGPPRPSGSSYQASNLRQSNLFGQAVPPPHARGKGTGGRGGGGRGGGRGENGGEGGEGPRFERLSSLGLELDGFREQDEASSLFSQSVRGDSKKKKKTDRVRSQELFGEDSDEDEDDDGVSVLAPSELEGGDGVEAPRRKKAKNGKSTDAEMLAAAAFGGAAGAGAVSSDDEDDDSASVGSSQQKAAMKAAFPIKGVNCVGCALAHRILPVECFVVDNINRMAPEALFKFAALTYQTAVVEPARKEGIVAPKWGWKDLRTHFLLHNSDPRIARASTINTLQVMRQAVESRLVRNDNGEKELDKGSCDLMLKIIKSESTERTLLSSAMRGDAKASGKGTAAGKSTVGDD